MSAPFLPPPFRNHCCLKYWECNHQNFQICFKSPEHGVTERRCKAVLSFPLLTFRWALPFHFRKDPIPDIVRQPVTKFRLKKYRVVPKLVCHKSFTGSGPSPKSLFLTCCSIGTSRFTRRSSRCCSNHFTCAGKDIRMFKRQTDIGSSARESLKVPQAPLSAFVMSLSSGSLSVCSRWLEKIFINYETLS